MVKLKLAREATHQCPQASRLGVVREVGKRVVISAYDKRLVNEIFLKVIRNSPLKGKELGLA